MQKQVGKNNFIGTAEGYCVRKKDTILSQSKKRGNYMWNSGYIYVAIILYSWHCYISFNRRLQTYFYQFHLMRHFKKCIPHVKCEVSLSVWYWRNKRHVISRICELKGISPKTNMPFSSPPFSNIREQALSLAYPN